MIRNHAEYHAQTLRENRGKPQIPNDTNNVYLYVHTYKRFGKMAYEIEKVFRTLESAQSYAMDETAYIDDCGNMRFCGDNRLVYPAAHIILILPFDTEW